MSHFEVLHALASTQSLEATLKSKKDGFKILLPQIRTSFPKKINRNHPMEKDTDANLHADVVIG
jgi:hypothetical protein